MRVKTKKFLEAIYTNPNHPAGFTGIEPLFKYGKQKDSSLTRSDVKKVLSHLDPYTLYKRNPNRFQRLKIKVKRPRNILSVDLADFQRISQFNDGHRFAIVAIDAFSRFGWFIPIRNKTGPEVSRVLEEHIFKHQRYPRLHVDRGLEFYNQHVIRMLKRYDSELYSTDSPIKAAHAERLIRTLKGRLYRWMNFKNTWRWIDVADQVIAAYNNTPHRAFKQKYTPEQVHRVPPPIPYQRLRELLYGSQKTGRLLELYKRGEVVRVAQSRFVHGRGFYPSNSLQLFRIKSAKHSSDQSRIPVYKIEDLNQQEIPGTFYHQELIPSVEKDHYPIDKILKERGKGSKKEYFVSFRGYPSSFNAWIKSGEIEKI